MKISNCPAMFYIACCKIVLMFYNESGICEVGDFGDEIFK